MVFQIIGLLILAAFYGCYFVKIISQKRRGISPDQMGKGKVGRVRAVEITTKLTAISAPVFEIVSIFWIAAALPLWIKIGGLCIASSGVAIFIISVITMRDNWRIGVGTDATELVTSGIYKFSRNPAFLGFDLVYVGILLTFFNWVLFGISIFAVFMLHLQIVLVEEPFLLSVFGEGYLSYKKKVFRYFGRFGGT